MKGIIITLLAVSALASAAQITLRPNGCPVDLNMHAQLPHENCNEFYLCALGVLITKTCPQGLHYNVDQQYCDWPVNVQCGNRILPEDKVSEPNSPEAICKEPNSNLVLIEHQYCNKFYKCMNRELVELQCSVGLMYNTELQTCDWSYRVDCESRIR